MSSVKDFGARGDGTTDDTGAILHAVDQGDGLVRFPKGRYRVSATIEIDLVNSGVTGIEGTGGTAKIIAASPGPAIRITGTHGGTGDPLSVKPEVWAAQRMPTVANIEIEGAHAGADGIQLEGTMQAVLQGVLVRRVRHGIRLHRRNRNVLITGCHIYHNTGVGVFLDHVNLHQINITGNHISYNRLGGIRVEGSEVRNLQITGNDIEYNNNRVHQSDPVPVADVLIDASGEDASVRETTIASNTIQATFSPGGANLRVLGNPGVAHGTGGMMAVTGNVIGSQETSVQLVGCRDITLTGNFLYSAQYRNLHIQRSRGIVIGANTFGHNPDYRDRELATGIRIEGSEEICINGVIVKDALAGRHTVPGAAELDREGLVELKACQRVTLAGCQIIDGTPYGIDVSDSSLVVLSGCTVAESRENKTAQAAVRWSGEGKANLVAGCVLGKGRRGAMAIEDPSGVTVSDITEVDG